MLQLYAAIRTIFYLQRYVSFSSYFLSLPFVQYSRLWLKHDPKGLMWPKSPMTNWLGPLAGQTYDIQYFPSCVHGPAPCGPITLSSIFFTFLPSHSSSVWSYSILFHSLQPWLMISSFLFSSLQFSSFGSTHFCPHLWPLDFPAILTTIQLVGSLKLDLVNKLTHLCLKDLIAWSHLV